MISVQLGASPVIVYSEQTGKITHDRLSHLQGPSRVSFPV